MSGFFDEVERGHFLISNLCDDDLNTARTKTYLRLLTRLINVQAKDKSHVFQVLYAAWAALSSEAFDLLQADFEIDENWLLRLERANAHIFERVLPYLNKTEAEQTSIKLIHIYAEMRRTRRSAETQQLMLAKPYKNKWINELFSSFLSED